MIRSMLALLPTGSTRRVALHLALTAVSVVLRAASAVLLVPLVAALFSRNPATAWPWVGMLALAIATGWVVDWLVARVAFELGFSLLDHGQARISERLDRIRLTWFDEAHTPIARGAVAAIGPELVGLVVYLATPLLAALLLPLAIAIALLGIAPPLGFAALAGVPVMIGAFLAAGRLSRAADRDAAEAESDLTERILEFARMQQALRAARRVAPAQSHAGAALDARHRATLRLLTMQVPGQLIFGLASQIALILLAGTTVWLAVRGEVTAPEAIALIVVIARYLEPFTSLAGLAAGTESTLAVLRRIRAVFEAPEMARGETTARVLGAPRLELRGLGFSYAGSHVLDSFDLTFEPGSTTAIVGPSGSGKSTILWLLAGLHHPDTGSIVVDGVDAATLDEDARRALTSVVFQDPFLFDATLDENVRAGYPRAGDDDRDDAASLARVDAIVDRLPDGWGTRAGEGGHSLSGGERQRISIARALLKPSPVLLVDEATSALDTENERAVVEDGSYDDLIAAGGRFAEFHAHQRAASAWRLGS